MGCLWIRPYGSEEVVADAYCARVTRRLQFSKYPDLMAQWPFAQEYEITCTLAGPLRRGETLRIYLL